MRVVRGVDGMVFFSLFHGLFIGRLFNFKFYCFSGLDNLQRGFGTRCLGNLVGVGFGNVLGAVLGRFCFDGVFDRTVNHCDRRQLIIVELFWVDFFRVRI